MSCSCTQAKKPSMPKLNVSFHENNDSGKIEYDPSFIDQIKSLDSDSATFIMPNNINEENQNVILRDACTIPEAIADTVEETITIQFDGNQDRPFFSVKGTKIERWLKGVKNYFIAYDKGSMRITKVKEPNHGVCLKQNVLATLITQDGDVFVGTNRCENPQKVCPREEQGMKSGEGYHLCKEICQQNSHAEVDAIRQAGEKARGGIIYLTGHLYACDNCQEAADNNDIEIRVRNEKIS